MKHRTDPIIEEIHETHRKIAERFDFDVKRITEDARRRQLIEGRPVWRPDPANAPTRRNKSGEVSEE